MGNNTLTIEQLAAINPCLPWCAYQKEIDPEAVLKHASWSNSEGPQPPYCPVYSVVLAFIALAVNGLKTKSKAISTAIPCGIRALASTVGDFFTTKVYYLYGEVATIKPEALQIACNWVAAGKKVRYYYAANTEDTAKLLKKACKKLGYQHFPEFVRLNCFFQLFRLVPSGQCDAVVIPRLPLPDSDALCALKGLALSTDTVILGMQQAFVAPDGATPWVPDVLIEHTDRVITVRTGGDGSVLYDQLRARR